MSSSGTNIGLLTFRFISPLRAPPAPYSKTPPSGSYPDGAYPGTVAVGPFNVFTETYRTDGKGVRFIPNPPLVTSNLPDTPVTPGIAVSNMIDLWEHCSAPDLTTCAAITNIKQALADAGCPNTLYNPGMIPATQLDLVYGWVISGCAKDFRPGNPATPAQKATFEHYLKLQYNYCSDVPVPDRAAHLRRCPHSPYSILGQSLSIKPQIKCVRILSRRRCGVCTIGWRWADRYGRRGRPPAVPTSTDAGAAAAKRHARAAAANMPLSIALSSQAARGAHHYV